MSFSLINNSRIFRYKLLKIKKPSKKSKPFIGSMSNCKSKSQDCKKYTKSHPKKELDLLENHQHHESTYLKLSIHQVSSYFVNSKIIHKIFSPKIVCNLPFFLFFHFFAFHFSLYIFHLFTFHKTMNS